MSTNSYEQGKGAHQKEVNHKHSVKKKEHITYIIPNRINGVKFGVKQKKKA